MSLFDAAERLAAIDHSAVVLDAARCLHSLERNSACEACFEICPVQAIQVGKPPSLKAEKCESCLACLTVCPVGAFSADDAVPDLLNAAAHAERRSLELVCARNTAPEKGHSADSLGIVVQGCLAGLGSGTYAALAPFGLENIVVRTEACLACRWAVLQPEIQAQVDRARAFLAAWDKTVTLSTIISGEMVERPMWKAANPPLSRRDLFRAMARQGQVALARAMENGVRAAGRRPGRDHSRLVGAAAHMPAAQEHTDVRLGALGFATVNISDSCSACGACGRACPTEALKCEIDEEQTKFSLKFSARACVGCDLCTRVCVPLAVTVNHDPAFAEVFGAQEVQLLEGELIKCKRCGAPTAKRNDSDLCDLCEFRRTHPFGAMLPPGANPGLVAGRKTAP